MRINHFIAAASDLSRRAADAAVAAGRVTVDGHPASLGEAVEPTNVVQLDGRRLRLPASHTYLMLHKPVGYVCSRVQQGSDPTIYNLLPPEFHRLRPVGRLDRDSSGLLLLSDDGAFIQRYTHPGNHKDKVYELELDHPLKEDDLERLRQGVKLEDGLSRVHVLHAASHSVTLSLGEGRNRQVRRTLGAVGYTVVSLHRTRVGHFSLDALPSSGWRLLHAEELHV